jgi:type I restriction enzyme S subunit
MKGWIQVKLSEVATIQSGSGFPEQHQGNQDEEIPFYKVSDMNLVGNERLMVYSNNTVSEQVRRQLGASIFPEGSTIFPKIGGAIATNKKRLTTRDCCVDNNVMGAVPRKEKIDSQYLFYFFLAHDLSEFANEAHLPSIKKTVVEECEIGLPSSLPEQRRIVGILDEAFEGIATAKANAERNLQNARALFESHLQSVFSQRGEGWVETSLGEAYDVRDGTHDSPRYHATGYPLITSKNLKRNGLSFDDVRLISEQDYRKINERSVVDKGDVLFAMIGTIGNPTLVEVQPQFAIKNVALFKIPRDQSGAFLKHYLDSELVITKMTKEAKGTTQRFVGLGYLRGFPINVPPLATQLDIVGKLDELSGVSKQLELPPIQWRGG